jgi:hypothetical protein
MSTTLLTLLKQALLQCQEMQEERPDVDVLGSIIAQLNYLRDLVEGKSSDRSRLDEIVIGVQAVRELESVNLELARLLYKIDAEVKNI